MKKNQAVKRFIETIFLLSPIFWSWGIVFNFPDTKYVLSRLMAIISVYCIVFYRDELKHKLNCYEFKLFIIFLFIVAIFYSFLSVYNNGHFDFSRVVWSSLIYFVLIPRFIFNKNTFQTLIITSSFVFCMVAHFQIVDLDMKRIGFVVNAGPYAYVVGLLLIVNLSISISELGASSKWKSLIFGISSIVMSFLLIFSQTRASWLAIFCIVVFCGIRLAILCKWRKLISLFIVFSAFIYVAKDISIVNDRFEYASTEYSKILKGDYNSSFGARVDMWRNGLEIFKSDYILGSNAKNERVAIQLSKELGTINRNAFHILNIERSNYHSVFIQSLVKGGLVGFLLSILWCFLILLVKKSSMEMIKIAFPLIIIYTTVSSLLESQFTIYSATAYFYLFLVGFFIMLFVNEKSTI